MAGIIDSIKGLFGGGSQSGKRVATRSGGKPESSFFSGTPEYNEQVPLYTKNQEAGLSQLFQSGLGGLEGLLQQLGQPYQNQGSPDFSPFQMAPFDFEPIAQQARTNFTTKTVPSLAQRFTGLGGPQSEGGQRSAAYPAALSSAGAGLEEGLAALRSQYGLKQQALAQNAGQQAQNYSLAQQQMGQVGQQNQRQMLQQLILSLLQLGGQQRFSTVQHAAQPGFTQNLLGGVGNALGGLASGYSSGLGLNSALKTLERF
jgi:hypothetical protein